MIASTVAVADSNELSPNEMGCRMEQDADRATDPAFNSSTDFFRVPAFGDIGDQPCGLVPIAPSRRVGKVQPPCVQLVPDSGSIPLPGTLDRHQRPGAAASCTCIILIAKRIHDHPPNGGRGTSVAQPLIW